MRILSFVKTLVAIPVLSFVLMSCSHPLVENGVDLAENERVWQYCKAFSLYGDRLPDESELGGMTDPGVIVDSLHDTMKYWFSPGNGYHAGEYYPSHEALYNSLYSIASVNNLASDQASVTATELNDSVAIVEISSFSAGTADSFSVLVPSLSSYPNIIVDLRNDGGGYVNVCRAIIEFFIPRQRGYLLVDYRNDNVATASDTGLIADEPWYASTTGDLLENKKVAILINNNSASASEIMAAALRDAMPAGKCALIGERSLGKGIGQSIFNFDQGEGGLRITSMQFKRVADVADADYHEKGIPPDYPADATSSVLCYAAAQDFFAGIPATRSTISRSANVNTPLSPEYGIAIVTVDTVH